MSFIRCLSNPEGLYIISNVSGDINIWCNQLKAGKSIDIPNKMFYKLVNKYAKYWDCLDKILSVGNDLSLQEVTVDEKTGKEVDVKSYSMDKMFKDPVLWKIKLTYKDEKIYLWRVTWHYVVHNAVEQNEKKKVKK